MRKFILVSALVLASASVQAGESRSLVLASNSEPAAVESAAPAETSKSAEQSSVAVPKMEPPAAQCQPAAKSAEAPAAPQSTKSAKPKHRHESEEARVIYELHRHGIYW